MSVNRIEDNVQLKNVLESNSRIVFLCGAGASMSLGSHGLNWSKWLLQSKSFLSDAEKSKLDNLMGNYSSDELIDAATFVIETLKNGGNYNTFMDTTIGRLHPSDKEFSQALCNIWRTGDIIATTNYDLQLEEAVGAQGISYSTSDKTLCVVRGLSDNRIIHLHGMYDNIHGIDDIIADSRQYDAILKDEGAQFVQNLIGTHAIILVGCGATVEDPNLSGFMNFLTDKIGILNIPYFYIMREGDDIPELPTNAVPVYYGTEYNDLPVFMKQLSVYRLISRLYLINGLISVNPYKNNSTVMSAFGRMHFSSGFNPFTGRDDEMSRLSSFIQCSDKYKWWVITGKGGIGKSRLVLEWLRTMKSDWVGFFVNKEAKSLINFEPFTNTVFVVDYIVGYEDKVASMIEILDNIICSSQYRLRLLFIERNQEEAEDHWLNKIIEKLSSTTRLDFETYKYNADFLEVKALSEKSKKTYIEQYLNNYLPLVKYESDDTDKSYIDYCFNHIGEVRDNIYTEYDRILNCEFDRPLYLSVFIEVWISKKGQLDIINSTELLREYLLKERKRWESVLGDSKLVNSYLRVLALACAIGHINITDMRGVNYMEKECSQMSDYFNEKNSIPGTRNIFNELFVKRDELVDSDESNSIFLKILGINKTNTVEYTDNNRLNKEDSDIDTDALEYDYYDEEKDNENKGNLDKDERIAYASPYIKLDGDPDEMFYNLLENAGALDEDEKEKLDGLRKKSDERIKNLPDYAWVIEPLLPDIIKEYIVLYTVKNEEVVKFTRLARSNSVMEFSRFLIRALEDWDSCELFDKMLVTPPSEVFNYFEYYYSLLVKTSKIKDYVTVEKELVSNEYTAIYYVRFEMELWRRIAIILSRLKDIDRLVDSSKNFFEYVKDKADHPLMDQLITDTISAYEVEIHNTGNIRELSSFLSNCDAIVELFPSNIELVSEIVSGYGRLIHLKRYHGKTSDVVSDWKSIVRLTMHKNLLSDDRIGVAIVKAAQEYLIVLQYAYDTANIYNLAKTLGKIYKINHLCELAEILARSYANLCGISEIKKEAVSNNKVFEKLKRLLSDYPDSREIRMSYIRCAEMLHQYHGVRDVPKDILIKAKEWEKLYPDDIEFKESYFGLLLTHLYYAQTKNARQAQQRIFDEMKKIAERANYDEYNEQNDLKISIRYLQRFYGYK